jgi:hypothetical protein
MGMFLGEAENVNKTPSGELYMTVGSYFCCKTGDWKLERNGIVKLKMNNVGYNKIETRRELILQSLRLRSVEICELICKDIERIA